MNRHFCRINLTLPIKPSRRISPQKRLSFRILMITRINRPRSKSPRQLEHANVDECQGASPTPSKSVPIEARTFSRSYELDQTILSFEPTEPSTEGHKLGTASEPSPYGIRPDISITITSSPIPTLDAASSTRGADHATRS